MTTKDNAANGPARRRFFKTFAAATAAGATMPAWALPTAQPSKWDQEFDVVIVGAGGGGLAAAVEAVDRGLSVAVLEKTPIVGGSSTICGGQFSCAGTEYQKANNVVDSDEIYFKDLVTTGGNLNDPALLKAFLPEARAFYNWLTAQGVQPRHLVAAAGMSVPRAHEFDPAQVIRTLREYATNKGAKIMLQTGADRLVWDESAHRVSGVLATSRGKPLTLRARKGVILASGGFSRNKKMLSQYSPLMAKAQVIAGLGCNGDGIVMAQAYGAEVLDTPYVKATYGFTMKPSTINDLSLAYYSGAIMVNKQGKRFVNESLSYKLLGDAALAQTDACGFMVLDDSIRKVAMTKSTPDAEMFAVFDKGGESATIFRANSIKEVAQKAGVDAAACEETVRRYNSYVDQGRDPEFGRTGLSTSYGKIVKIEKAPFYVMPATAALIGTYCGVRIDPRARVMDVFGEPIPGLHAVGEMTGGFHGSAYMTGTAFAKAMVFGRLAARDIASSASA